MFYFLTLSQDKTVYKTATTEHHDFYSSIYARILKREAGNARFHDTWQAIGLFMHRVRLKTYRTTQGTFIQVAQFLPHYKEAGNFYFAGS